jgi:FAD binding domain
MIRRNGAKTWKNIHVTVNLDLEDLIDIDNSNALGHTVSDYQILKQTSTDINSLIKEAKTKNKRIRAIGSAWALSSVQVTENWLINTKLLNKCIEVETDCFHADYANSKKPYLVIAQCGISIAELNVYLELPRNASQEARSLKTTGIGAGQTIVGAVSGNTHGSAINFGAVPDFVVAIQLCNGTDKPIWIERGDYHVMNQQFLDRVDSKLISDSDIFNSVLVGFGAFGVITAFAIETEPIYQITFPTIEEVNQSKLGSLLGSPAYYNNLHHLEFVFNPYTDDSFHLIAGKKVKYEEGHPIPAPLWIITNKLGYAPGDWITKLALNFPFVSAKFKSKVQFKEYLKHAVLSDVRGTSGQLYTATITYLEGYNETAFAVSIDDAMATIQILKQLTREKKLPFVIQARAVQPGNATFGFTNHTPKAVVFEYGIVNDPIYPEFEQLLINQLKNANIRYTLHWSKNSLVNKERLVEMYSQANVDTWKESRNTLFDNDSDLIRIFNNVHLAQAELDT